MKVIAAQHDTSLNSLVRNFFADVAASGLHETDAMNGNLQTLFDYSVGRIGRRKARELLGVEDVILTTMLRQAGFPPPRAASKDEDAMLARMKDVHLA
jgi:hypothetical protein